MARAALVVVPAGRLLDRVERTAWRVPVTTRRLFVTLALAAAAALVASGLAAGWIVSRNAGVIRDARAQGLDLAIATSDFRTNLIAADAAAAGTLISGGLEDRETRQEYDRGIDAAGEAVTGAALVATAADRDDLATLQRGLTEYAGLVETARANVRLGFPIGTSYLDAAHDLAQDELVPTADRLRRVGEQRLARASRSVGGPVGVLAVAVLVAGLVVVAGCAALVAGRTRRVLHPALLAATVVSIVLLVEVTGSIVAQTRELSRAATDDIAAYVAANDASGALAGMRVTEIAAVAARGGGADIYDRVGEDAGDLLGMLEEAPGDRARLDELHRAVATYGSAVTDVRSTDEAGDNQGAAELALSGSDEAYRAAVAIAAGNVEGEVGDVRDRLGTVEDAGVHPAVPAVLGGAAALLAAGGILARGRRYR